MSPSISARLLATQSDQRLLDLVRKGHERAFEAVVHRYRRPLLAYCRRMGLADSRAEDVLQQALLKAWLALQAGSEIRELRPWLYRIVHNTAVNAIRSSPERRGVIVDGVALENVVGDSELERRIAARDALSDVAALPQMQRDAILLSAVDGRSHEEVASALGISNGAVRGLIYRARATLRSAAAALIPQPLLAWAAGSASRVGPTAGRLAELSSSGGGDVAGMAIKGTTLAVSAALAAGAVLGPLHGQGGHGRSAARLPSARISAEAHAPGSSGAPLAAGVADTAGDRLGRTAPAAARQRSSALAHGNRGARRRGERRHGDQGTEATGQLTPTPRSPGSGDGSHRGDGSSGAGRDRSGSGSGDQATSGPGSPGETQPSGGGDKGGSESEAEKAQREAEEAEQRKQQEADAAREKAQREAEEAREREAEANDSSTTSGH